MYNGYISAINFAKHQTSDWCGHIPFVWRFERMKSSVFGYLNTRIILVYPNVSVWKSILGKTIKYLNSFLKLKQQDNSLFLVCNWRHRRLVG